MSEWDSTTQPQQESWKIMYERDSRDWKIEKESSVLDVMDEVEKQKEGRGVCMFYQCVCVCACVLTYKCLCVCVTGVWEPAGGLTDYLSWNRLEAPWLSLSLSHFLFLLLIFHTHSHPLLLAPHKVTATLRKFWQYMILRTLGWVSTFILFFSHTGWINPN